MFRRVAHRANLHIGTARRDRDHHLQRRAEQTAIAFDHTDQSPKHQFCRIEISDHAIFQRTDCTNILMGFTMHLAGLLTDSHQLTGMLVDRHDRRLIDNDFAVVYDNRVGRTQVNGQLLCQ